MELLDIFIQSQQSLSTQDSYRRNIIHFMNFLNITDEEYLSSIKTMDVDKWNIKLKDTISDSSRKTKLSALSSFFNFLQSRGYVNSNPVEPIISKLKVKIKPQTFLTQEEAHKTLDSLSNKSNDCAIRNYAILTLLENTAMRISELINIKLKDIKENKIMILGKGNKYRTLYLNNQVLEAINDYIKIRKKSNYDNLFISNQNTPMKRNVINKMIKRIVKEVGIDKKISPHGLRRTGALILYKQNGKDAKLVQSILGHQDASTTLNRYLIYDNEDIMNAMLKTDI